MILLPDAHACRLQTACHVLVTQQPAHTTCVAGPEKCNGLRCKMQDGCERGHHVCGDDVGGSTDSHVEKGPTVPWCMEMHPWKQLATA